jgi:hypothetical protein
LVLFYQEKSTEKNLLLKKEKVQKKVIIGNVVAIKISDSIDIHTQYSITIEYFNP